MNTAPEQLDFDIQGYIREALMHGRNHVSAHWREKIAAMMAPFRLDPRQPDFSPDCGLWERFLWCENFTALGEKHNYASYTYSPVFDCYLDAGTDGDFWRKNKNVWYALAALVNDWFIYEMELFNKYTSIGYTKKGYRPELVADRLQLLKELKQSLMETENSFSVHRDQGFPDHGYPHDIEYFRDADAALTTLVMLTGLPGGIYHDEYMFLRMVQLTECIFFAVGEGVHDGLAFYQQGELQRAADIFRQLTVLMDVLSRLFSVMDTLAVENFYQGFRVDTGNAGAIQSEKYQWLERLLTGIQQDKLGVVLQIAELRDKSMLKDTAMPTLRQLYQTMLNCRDCPELAFFSQRLLHQFQFWKARHLAIAIKMLPKNFGAEGPLGIGYLKSNLRNNMTEMRRHSREVPEVRLSTRARQLFEGLTLVWVQCTDVDLQKLQFALQTNTEDIRQSMLEHADLIEHNLDDYQRFFSSKQAAFPLRKQMQHGLPAPTVPLVPRLLLHLEFYRGVLAGVFDIDRIDGDVLVDVSIEAEVYSGIGKSRQVICQANELVLRDQAGVMASYFSGPGSRTAMAADGPVAGRRLGLMLFSSPAMAPGSLEDTITLIHKLFSAAAGTVDLSYLRFQPGP